MSIASPATAVADNTSSSQQTIQQQQQQQPPAPITQTVPTADVVEEAATATEPTELASVKDDTTLTALEALNIELAYRTASEFARLRGRPHVVKNPQLSTRCSSYKRFTAALKRAGYKSLTHLLSNHNNYLLAFHGTRVTENIPSILCGGFDPKRRAGQAYGPGEYFDVEGGTASGYRGSTGCFLVTIVINKAADGTQFTWVRTGQILVVNNDRDDKKDMAELPCNCLPLAMASEHPLQADSLSSAKKDVVEHTPSEIAASLHGALKQVFAQQNPAPISKKAPPVPPMPIGEDEDDAVEPNTANDAPTAAAKLKPQTPPAAVIAKPSKKSATKKKSKKPATNITPTVAAASTPKASPATPKTKSPKTSNISRTKQTPPPQPINEELHLIDKKKLKRQHRRSHRQNIVAKNTNTNKKQQNVRLN